jgi:hypothetical protein
MFLPSFLPISLVAHEYWRRSFDPDDPADPDRIRTLEATGLATPRRHLRASVRRHRSIEHAIGRVGSM